MFYRVMPPRSSPFFLGRKTRREDENYKFVARDLFSWRRLVTKWSLSRMSPRLLGTCVLLLILVLIFCFPPSLSRRSSLLKPEIPVNDDTRAHKATEGNLRPPTTIAATLIQKFALQGNDDDDDDDDARLKLVTMATIDVTAIVNPHNFQYIINEEDACWQSSDESVFLLIFVASSLEHYERRTAIRRTWGDKERLRKHNVRLLFLTGVERQQRQHYHHQDRQRLLVEEKERFHDIIQEDFVDSYRNLSLKSVMGLKWMATYCSKANYVMKTDDDIYINALLLVEFLKNSIGMRRHRWIGGCIKQIRSPLPFNKEGAKVDTMTIGHPLFAAGAGYVISGDTVPLLFQASLFRHIVPVEDAYVTGYCASMLGVVPTHYDGFSCGEPVMDDCEMAFRFVGHHVMPERQISIWKTLNENNVGRCKNTF